MIDGKYLIQSAADAYASGDYNTCEVMWDRVREDGPVIGFQNSAIVEETYEAGVAEAKGDNLDAFNSSDFWMNLETVGRVTLDNLTDAKPEVPEEFTQVQNYTLKSGKFPGTEMLVYANDALDHFRFEFSLFGDSFIMNVTVEDGVVYAFDKSGFFGADAPDFYNDIDRTAWTAR